LQVVVNKQLTTFSNHYFAYQATGWSTCQRVGSEIWQYEEYCLAAALVPQFNWTL